MMSDSQPGSAAPVPADSAHAAQFQRGFRWLVFDAPLEQEFRRMFLANSLPQVRRNLWIAAAFTVAISLLTHKVLDPHVNRQLDLIRLGVFGPLLMLGLSLVHSRWYHRFHALASLVAAPIFGAGVTIIAVIAATHGVSLIATVVLVSIYIYFMLGMRFYPALISASLVFVSYLCAAFKAGLPPGEITIDTSMLVFANVVGAMVCYNLEHANRTNFLESCLLTENASRDGLTGIHNRRVFDEQLERMWTQAIREQAPLALMLIDIDHFKAYNDYYGHQAGDECLRQVAHCLMRSARRPLDVTARYGGEEFAIVLYNARRDYVDEVARGLQSAIETLAIRHVASPSGSKRLTVSVGAACIVPTAGRSHFGFIQLADEALYAAKEQGRDRIVIMDKEYEQLSTGSFRRTAAVNRA